MSGVSGIFLIVLGFFGNFLLPNVWVLTYKWCYVIFFWGDCIVPRSGIFLILGFFVNFLC